jgi:hypothetical protein
LIISPPTAERVGLLARPETADAVRRSLGENVFAELAAISKPTEAHLDYHSPPNLIFVPGVMGSLLQSETKGGVWWLDVRSRQHLDDLGLAPDGIGDTDCFRVAYQSPLGLAAIAMFSTSPDLTNKSGFATESAAT